MALLKILVFPDPRLRTVAEPVTEFDDSLKQSNQNDMLETMYEGSGIGLSSNTSECSQKNYCRRYK